MDDILRISISQSNSLSIEIKEKVNEYGRFGLEGAVNTQRAYKSDLKDFNEWCETNGQIPFPVTPETLAVYVSHLADACKWATINRRLAAISKLHQLNNLETPTQNRIFRIVMEHITSTILHNIMYLLNLINIVRE